MMDLFGKTLQRTNILTYTGSSNIYTENTFIVQVMKIKVVQIYGKLINVHILGMHTACRLWIYPEKNYRNMCK